jgi:hypothetical protein
MRGRFVVVVVATLGALLLTASSARSRQLQEPCFGSPATITGSGMIVGTDGDDVILASDGGNDSLQGGPDTDVCDGGTGSNTAVAEGPETCESAINAVPPPRPPIPTVISFRATLGVKQQVPRPRVTRQAGPRQRRYLHHRENEEESEGRDPRANQKRESLSAATRSPA